MKTIDAVNEFKGEWPVIRYTTDNWIEGSDKLHYCEGLVCSKMMFNILAQECMTNFGRSSFKHLAIWQAELNESKESKVEIDWSLAPEGCVGYSVSTASNHYWMFSCHQVPAPDFGFTEFKFHPKPQPKESNMKPVFTQEMSDNRELPPIGSEYLDEDGQLCKALLHYSSFVVGDMIEHMQIQQYPTFSTSRNDRISVIDTRTNKEKACDAIWKELDDSGKEYDLRVAMELAYDKWTGK